MVPETITEPDRVGGAALVRYMVARTRQSIALLVAVQIGCLLVAGALVASPAQAEFTWSGTLAVSDHFSDTYGGDCSGSESRTIDTSWSLVPNTGRAVLTAAGAKGSGSSVCTAPVGD